MSQELEDILRRPASSVYDLAQAAVARSRELSGGLSSISKSDSETKTPCGSESYDIVSDIPLTMEEEGNIWSSLSLHFYFNCCESEDVKIYRKIS